ncbi:hypothetical protein HRG_002126 [Hirsutella rhossiliensis]|uniref:Uncharacterized protein n=1 Tax=Hirsutella rhossiliensis TaxID=111463 RepID=A0A9P8N8S2_9HYPO|nr:uncharacterized protein HRG_02126 [Hirsutella rhossiliensis]KAH0966717.1 hypothetical protein HRG_02126 [Hirsutella rhossiliensis]
MEEALNQPDFSEAAGGLRTAADHLDRCRNLPAVDGGARLAETLQTVLERIGALERTMQRRFDQVDRRMDGLDRKVTVSNRNAVIRAQNSTVVRADMELEPLYSVLTGEPLDQFPETLDRLERLQLAAVNDLLTHLGEVPRGRVEERRRQLKLASGVVTRAV